MGAHLVAHGDGVKDVSFAVEDLEGIMIQCRTKEGKCDLPLCRPMGTQLILLLNDKTTKDSSCQAIRHPTTRTFSLQRCQPTDFTLSTTLLATSQTSPWRTPQSGMRTTFSSIASGRLMMNRCTRTTRRFEALLLQTTKKRSRCPSTSPPQGRRNLKSRSTSTTTAAPGSSILPSGLLTSSPRLRT